MSSGYEIVIIHKDLNDFAREVIDSIRSRNREIFLQPNLVEFKNSLEDVAPDGHVVVIYLGSIDGAKDELIGEALDIAVGAQIPVVPLMRELEPGSIPQKLPQSIRRLNAVDWVNNRSLAFDTLLRVLGLTEPERKVFLSYFRTESASLAEQLHTALTQAQFDVFLDRFSVPPGEDFQRRLDEELADKAFVVLIESPGLGSSHWVEHEISYAQSHRIGILGITLPETSPSELVPSLSDAFRIRLASGDIDSSGRLVPQVLLDILDHIQIVHASELRRRREQLIGSLRDKLFMDGCTCEPIEDWALLATAEGKKPAVFLITPRRPNPEDLFQLHQIASEATARIGRTLAAAVIHETEHIDAGKKGLLQWISEPRELESMLLRDCLLDEEASS